MATSLPYVNINFANGQLGITTPSEDGICGLVPAGAVSVSSYTEKSGTAYKITSLSCLDEAGTDALTYEMVREFYAESGEGSYLWIESVKPSDAPSAVKALQEAANGACRAIGITTALAVDPTTEVKALQAEAEDLTKRLFAPVLVVAGIAAPATVGDAVDLTSANCNRVAVVCGNCTSDTAATEALLEKAASVGLLLGRIASKDVQVSVARVSDGAIAATEMMLGASAITTDNAKTLHGKGYITPRSWTGKAGYYWSDDVLATAAADDYGLIPRRRTIDKAYRLAYATLLNEVNAEIAVSSTGGIAPSVAKSIESVVATALETGMTAKGNLGTDPDDDSDTGVKVYVDPDQPVVSTSTLSVSVKVKPFGYAKYIEAVLSFYTNAN